MKCLITACQRILNTRASCVSAGVVFVVVVLCVCVCVLFLFLFLLLFCFVFVFVLLLFCFVFALFCFCFVFVLFCLVFIVVFVCVSEVRYYEDLFLFLVVCLFLRGFLFVFFFSCGGCFACFV